MSYVQKVLLPGEQVIYETGLHWLVYLRAMVFSLLAVAAAVVAIVLAGGTQAGGAQAVAAMIAWGVTALLGAMGFFAFLSAAIRRATTELAVTDQRIVYKAGIISRHTLEMNRSKVESVDVDQSILGRIFSYGTVVLRGTGGSLEPMENIEHPLTFRSRITVEPVRHAAAPGAG